MTGVTVIFPRVSFLLNKQRFFYPAGLLCLLLFASFRLTASEYLSISLGDVGNDQWQAKGVVLQLDLLAEHDQYVLSADEVRHPALPTPARKFKFRCDNGKISSDGISCKKGLLDVELNGQSQRQVNSRIDWKINAQIIDIYLDNVVLSGGKVSADLKLDRDQWRLLLDGNQIDIQQFPKLHTALAEPIARFSLNGRVDLSMDLRGRGTQLSQGSSRIKYAGVGFSSEPGDYIGQGLTGEWQGRVVLKKGQWLGTQQIALSAGEVLTPFLYLSPSSHPLNLTTRYAYRADTGLLTLDELHLNQPGRLEMTGSTSISLKGQRRLVELQLASKPADIGALFRDNVLPVLGDPQLEDVELAGQFSLDLVHQAGQTRIGIVLKDAHIEQGVKTQGDGKGQFALYGLAGDINWSDGSTTDSRLSWQGGHLFGDILLGASSLELNLSDGGVALLKQASIPILDGTLQAEQFSLQRGEAGPRVQFQGYLTPISMTAISAALDWPPLSGQLSGMIPGLAYEDGVIAVNGLALVKLFDGNIVIRDLKLDDLFGALPALSADLEIKDVDLETLTRAFSFGKITGKLAGHINDLRLEDWTPVSFDAAFYTPEGDDSRHRISQKAVDNISNLGGSGVSGAISRSFLRMFEEFGYDRLGISCRLERGVCHMGGIEPAERGYYLVKGGGLPRIHIMGYNEKTDWPVLVSKLKQIAAGGEPVIK